VKGTVLISVNDTDKKAMIPITRTLEKLGFRLMATAGTAAFLGEQGFKIEQAYKVHEGRPDIVDCIKNKEIALIINTPLGKASMYDEVAIRRAAVDYRIPYITTIAGAHATANALEALIAGELTVKCLQEYHAEVSKL
jgi:carbamoyl-phosphate synthase large subunit